MKLYAFPPSPRAMKVIALAEHLQIEHETQVVDLTKGDQMKPEFTALNPNQRMPVLEDDGFVLWESNAILQYLALKEAGRGGAVAVRPAASARRKPMDVLGSVPLGARLRNSRFRAGGQEIAGAGRRGPSRGRQGRAGISPGRRNSQWRAQGPQMACRQRSDARRFRSRTVHGAGADRAISGRRVDRDRALVGGIRGAARDEEGARGVAAEISGRATVRESPGRTRRSRIRPLFSLALRGLDG